ncbi:hypothetical protein [Hyalangium minutum]|uniref:Uncharacterized protein n=1 Tax=Hyalangium minutum TaxID=394096 RepID=A0A085WPB6_9BACT|nr:hypothetical protein [Hyalangium minutum]KFE69529.1 hypothetical protein DB31_6504 [Hyalangium minutum]
MSLFPLDSQPWRRSLILGTLTVLAVSVSACGQQPTDEETLLSNSQPKQTSSQSLGEEPCTAAQNGGAPTLSLSDAVIKLQCGVDTWEPPEVTATDACGQPLEVHRYNTGDDDQDGAPGSGDSDDFGPGPDDAVEGIYYVQYLAWDSYYNIQGAILEVHVENCTP